MSKVARSLQTDDFYDSYVLKMKEKKLVPKTKSEYRKFVETMGSVLADEILKNGIVQLPWRMGDVILKNRTGPRHLILGDKVGYVFNDHSEGIRKTFFWLSKDRLNKKIIQWCFSAERKMRRNLAVEILKNKREYPDFAKILNLK